MIYRPIPSMPLPPFVLRIFIGVLLTVRGAQSLHRNRRSVGEDIVEWRQNFVVDLDRSITTNCLEQSEYRDCTIFNRCCDFRCVEARPAESPTRRRELLNAVAAPQQQPQRRHLLGDGEAVPKHFCIAILGEILADNTRCMCNSAVSSKFYSPFGFGGESAVGVGVGGGRLSALLQKIDFVGSVILLFVFDLLLLSFTL